MRTHTCMDMLSESCTPAQHTVMSAGSSSVGVMPLGGAAQGEDGHRVNLSPLVKFTRSWLSNNKTCICSELGNV